MKPISYTRNGDNVDFKYSLSDLKQSYEWSKNTGRFDMFVIKISNGYCKTAQIRYDLKFYHYFITQRFNKNIDDAIDDVMNPKPFFNMYDEFGEPLFEFVMMNMGKDVNSKKDTPPLRERFKH